MTTAEKLQKLAADWGSPHVRRQSGRIKVLLDRLTELDIPWRRDGRQVLIGPNAEYLGTYDHPHRNPRARGCIAIRESGAHLKWRTGKVVYVIDTEEDLAFFIINPKRWLTKL